MLLLLYLTQSLRDVSVSEGWLNLHVNPCTPNTDMYIIHIWHLWYVASALHGWKIDHVTK